MFLIFLLVIFAVVPVGLIHGLNVLFHTNIPITFETWYMTAFFCMVVRLLLTPIVIKQELSIHQPQQKSSDELPPSET